MTRTVIIDGDVVVYKVAEAIAESFEVATEEDDEYIYRNIGYANKQQAADRIEAFIERICKDTHSTEVVICLSDMKGNFRKQINPTYKGNRKAIKPILNDYLRRYLQDSGYKVYVKDNLEADDTIGILATSPKIIKGDKVVWSLDKDFKTIPCKFRRERPTGEHISKVITEDEANWWFMYQTLIGDKCDGYAGCPKIGDKTARKILGEVGEHSLKDMWILVVATYENNGLTEEDALLNARMARILRAEDYDFKTKEIKLWKMQ